MKKDKLKRGNQILKEIDALMDNIDQCEYLKKYNEIRIGVGECNFSLSKDLSEKLLELCRKKFNQDLLELEKQLEEL